MVVEVELLTLLCEFGILGWQAYECCLKLAYFRLQRQEAKSSTREKGDGQYRQAAEHAASLASTKGAVFVVSPPI